MSEGRIPVAVEIRVKILKEGDISDIGADVRNLNVVMTDNVFVVKQGGEQARRTGTSMRGLAMDLRMLSIGLSILKREFGGMNPVIDTSISALYVLSGATSAGVGAYRLLQRATNALGGDQNILSGIVKALSSDWAGLSVAAKGFVVVAGTIIGLQLGTWVVEAQTGISRMRQETKMLTRDIEDLQVSMLGLKDVSADLSTESAMLNYQILKVRQQIDLTGDPTGRLEQQLKALEAQQQDFSVRSAENAFRLTQISEAATHAANDMARYQHFIREEREQHFAWYSDPRNQRDGGRTSPGPGGGLSGIPRPMASPEGMAAPALLNPALGGGPSGNIAVSISFPGATFNSGIDIERALARGGELAGGNIRRSMAFDRRGVRGSR